MLVTSIAAAILVLAPPALAGKPRVEVPAGIESCPSADELHAAIGAHLGREDYDRAAPPIEVRVRRGEGDTGTLVAEIAIGATRPRRIDPAETCSDLFRAAALSIALALETDAPPPPPSAAPPAVFPDALPRDAAEDRAVVTASALTSIGILPRPSAGLGVSGRVRLTRLVSLSARGLWLPEGTMPDGSFALGLKAAGAGACIEPFGSRTVRAVGCAHLVGGAYSVMPRELPVLEGSSRAYVAATVSAGARLRVAGPMHLEAALDAHVPFVRPTYVTAACPEVGFQAPFVALAMWLGAGISIP